MKSVPDILRAAIAAILASLMFASMGMAVRYSSATLSNEMVVFLRNLFGLICLLPWFYYKGFNVLLPTQRFRHHMLRSLSGLTAMYCFFYAIAHLELAEAVLLNYSSPLFIAMIAILWLGEKVSIKIVFAILIGFAGICLILKPGMGVLSYPAWMGLASGLFAALAMVTIRDLSSTEPITRILFYYTVTATCISVIPLFWRWENPGLSALLVMMFAGIAASLGQIFLTYSYSLAPASKVSPYTYFTVVFAAMYGWIFWAEIPDIYMIGGTALVIYAGMITLHTPTVTQISEPD